MRKKRMKKKNEKKKNRCFQRFRRELMESEMSYETLHSPPERTRDRKKEGGIVCVCVCVCVCV